MLKFFALTYSAAWACFFAAVAVTRPSASPGELSTVQTGLLMLGTVAPSLVALGLTWLDRSASGVGELLRPVLRTEAPVRCYVFAVGYLLAIKLAAAFVYRVFIGAWPAFGTTP